MTIRTSLHTLAHSVCTLLECSGATLSLASPSEACHPLLNICTALQENDVASLLSLQQVQALMICAMQERSIQRINACALQFRDVIFRSIAIVPLERPAGILGFLICVDTQSNRFLQGEYTLLEQAVPSIAREVENILCTTMIPFSQDERVSQSRAVLQEQHTLVSLVGHDLRMPLTAIKGYTGLLQAYGPMPSSRRTSTQADLTPELQQHFLDVIMEQTQHMEVLVNDLLDVSRIQSRQLTLRYTQVNIVSLSRRVAQIVQDKCDQQQPGKYTIRCRFDAESELVWADPDRLLQVLMNLVENAVKYSPDGGLIEVRVRSNSTMTSSITVRDWGLGIPRQQQDSLFHAFSRGEQLKQRRIGGLGLGLYIVRTLIEAMDGSITVRSSEGNGTSISFTLPSSHDRGCATSTTSTTTQLVAM